MTDRIIEYRLSWEMPADTHKVAEIEQRLGKDVWPSYNWESLEWDQISVIWKDSEESDRLNQHATLKKWAETREQPIRNVKLEWRPVNLGNWEPVEP